MTARIGVLGSVAFASVIVLSGCGNTAQLAPPYVSVAISPRPASLPVGTSVVLTGTVSNNLNQPQWSILDASYSNNPGTLTPASGSSSASVTYTAPATPPIYTQTPTGITQGTVTVNATTTPPSGTSIPVAGDSVSFFITAPTITLSLSPATANVPLGTTQQFIGYAVGNINNALTWQLNGFPGGSVPVPLSSPTTYTYPYGTVNTAGTYVAPTTMPSGGTVTITIVSAADFTKTASATVTLQ